LELLEKLAGRRVVASISGGKDSGALSLHLQELGIEHERVFLDTGWEHPSTYEYLRGPLTQALGPIAELRAPLQMEELVLKKAMFPSRKVKWCTEQLKLIPMQEHIKRLQDEGREVVDAVGIRREESTSRSTAAEWEWSDTFDCEIWRPLVAWTEADVIAIHQRHGLRPNPLYLQGAKRVGCWPCIFAKKAEIRLIADLDPARIDRLRALEAKVTEAQHAKIRARGEEPYGPAGWFQQQAQDANGKYPARAIDEVVAWSRTSRGGAQFEMFAAAGRDQGCMRWGLCDTGAAPVADAEPDDKEAA
jgi:3'-phosphoadenosine 5'-phosphosulfate sulfotransferase (PAPS reductase)/FAD synthetase